jgi:NADPH-dependent 2,4-dienoyl-CoA reductase/sulfur reductase-like enzyme/rhodanese-related sulfurtransferase
LAAEKLRIVIIGGVATGPKAAARARRMAPDAEIVLVDSGSILSYGACGMPFYLEGQVKDLKQLLSTAYGVTRDEQFFLREKGINVLTRTRATGIDRERKTVALSNLDTGEEFVIPYDKLVLATGARPTTPPFEGINLNGAYRLHHPNDACKIMENMDRFEDMVVVGGGFIGLEVAGAFSNRRLFVSLIEMHDQILPGVLDPDLEAILRKRLENRGMEFYLGHRIVRFEGDTDGNLVRIITDKEQIDTKAVIMAVGVRPNVDLAREAGLEIGPTGAIAVNEYLQTSDPDIYAAGDCTETTHVLTGRRVYLPLASTANRQGRVVGDNVTGRRTRFKGVMGTAVLQIMDWNVGRTGIGESEARVLGYDVLTTVTPAHDRSHFHPDHSLVILKIIMDQKTRKVLGVQAIGPGDVDKRIDVAASALHFGATIDDLSELDLGYAPPYNTVIDPLQHTANAMRNKADGLSHAITPQDLKQRLERGEELIILDVRTEREFKFKKFQGGSMTIPLALSDLREKLQELPRDKQVIVLCESGVRSYEALRTLEGAGFENVEYLEGGLQAWPYGPSGLMS